MNISYQLSRWDQHFLSIPILPSFSSLVGSFVNWNNKQTMSILDPLSILSQPAQSNQHLLPAQFFFSSGLACSFSTPSFIVHPFDSLFWPGFCPFSPLSFSCSFNFVRFKIKIRKVRLFPWHFMYIWVSANFRFASLLEQQTHCFACRPHVVDVVIVVVVSRPLHLLNLFSSCFP